MNTTLFYILMVFGSLLMAALPFGVLMGLGALLNIPGTSTEIFMGYGLIALVVIFLISFGSFALIQKSSCGEVKNYEQVAMNAGISVLFQFSALLLVSIIPWFRNIVSNILPPGIDPVVRLAAAYGYYSMWASGFGYALGGMLSSSCARAITPEEMTFKVPEEVSVPVSSADSPTSTNTAYGPAYGPTTAYAPTTQEGGATIPPE
jgi:hypothetical protein